MSVLSPSLIAAFRATHFRVFVSTDDTFTLRVDQFSAQLSQLYRQTGACNAAYLTAWNPYSAETATAVNHAQQAKLLEETRAAGHATLQGFGVDPSTDYPVEDHLLVLGMDRKAAIVCGMRYQQNSILWCGENATPELILLR